MSHDNTNPIIAAVLQAGLADEQIRDAILNYVQAATRALNPPPEWREVYRRESDDVRVIELDEPHPHTGIRPYRRNLKLYMIVDYHEGRQAGRIEVFSGPEGLFTDPNWYGYLGYHSTADAIVREATVAPTYHDLIDFVIAQWPHYLELFDTYCTELIAGEDDDQ